MFLKLNAQRLTHWKENVILKNLSCIYIKTLNYGDKNIDTLMLLKYLYYETVKILRKRDKLVRVHALLKKKWIWFVRDHIFRRNLENNCSEIYLITSSL